MPVYTRAEMYDYIRERVGVVPPSAYPSTSPQYGEKGAQPKGQPYPNNALLKHIIEEAAADINLRANVGMVTSLSKSVTGTTTNGPLAVQLEGDWQGLTGQQQVNTVYEVWWDENAGSSSSDNQILLPVSLNDLARDRRDYHDEEDGTPRQYAIEGYTLYLIPAPTENGTLYMRASAGLMAPLSDKDTIRKLPGDLYGKFLDICISEVCAIQPDRSEMRDRLAYYAPKAMEARDLIAKTIGNQNARHQSSITFRSHRTYQIARW